MNPPNKYSIGLILLASSLAMMAVACKGPVDPPKPPDVTPPAALGLVLPALQIANCSVVAIPLTVTNFRKVSGVQLDVTYNPANVTFDSVGSSVLNDAMWNATSGIISVVWADMSQTSPRTLGDGNTLAVFYFSGLTGTSALSFQSQTKVVDSANAYFTLNKTDGSMTCTGN